SLGEAARARDCAPDREGPGIDLERATVRVQRDLSGGGDGRRRLERAAIEAEAGRGRAEIAVRGDRQGALIDRPKRRRRGRVVERPGAAASLGEGCTEALILAAAADLRDVEGRRAGAAQRERPAAAGHHDVAGDGPAGVQLQTVGAAGEGDGVGARAARDGAAVDDRQARTLDGDGAAAATADAAGAAGTTDRSGGSRTGTAGAATAAAAAAAAGAAIATATAAAAGAAGAAKTACPAEAAGTAGTAAD